MKHLLLAGFLLLTGASTVFAQTTAADFTANDCNGVSHNLYSELNSGKVVVFVWVMPCSACASDSKGSYDAAQSFASTHPGKVVYMISDDNGSTSCANLASWATANGVGSNAILMNNTGNVINEANYGGSGMPHVAVFAGADHKIYYNQKNGSGSQAAIQTAISTALAATTGIQPVKTGNALSLYPNPVVDAVSVSYTLRSPATVSIEIYDIKGSRVQTEEFQGNTGDQTRFLKLHNDLNDGYYLLKLNAEGYTSVAGFTVAR
jgi:hypothetical protein